MHVIPPYSTNRAFSRVKLSQAHKQADVHNLCPHKRSVMPEVAHYRMISHPRIVAHPECFSTPFYCQADISEALRIIRPTECVNKSMKERGTK